MTTKTYYIVAHNDYGRAYIRETRSTDTTIYADCELAAFKTMEEAETFWRSVDPLLARIHSLELANVRMRLELLSK